MVGRRVRDILRNMLFAPIDKFNARLATTIATTQQRVLLGRIAARQVHGLGMLRSLADTEFQVFSQWGEDGIIEWLIDKLGCMPETFIEFGVENYCEANTRFLMFNRNWRGLVIDGSQDNIDTIRASETFWRHDLVAKGAFITAENINEQIVASGFEGEVGLLSIDLDGNDYWIWKAITVISPVIVIIEYNAVFGDLLPLTIPYDGSFNWSKAHRSRLYFGASIRALRDLAAEKGYTFVGTNSSGCNAFFIRDDHASTISRLIENTTPRPSRFRGGRDEAGKLSLIRAAQRRIPIADCLLTDVSSGRTDRFGAFDPIYSENWLGLMDGKARQFK